MPGARWDDLTVELDAWAERGRRATLWLRDDDAQTRTGALERLLHLGERFRVPFGLAVIPDGCEPLLSKLLERYSSVSVLQHGYSHQNHAPAEQKKAEYGDHRKISTMLQELNRGNDCLSARFPDNFLPVLVPPWNRISNSLMGGLTSIGFKGLSTYQPRPRREPFVGLVQSNCHADLIDWRASRSFVGNETILEQITAHLGRRRLGDVDDEVTGLLTHHRNHDRACWGFLECLLERTRSHPAVRWLSVSEVMWGH